MRGFALVMALLALLLLPVPASGITYFEPHPNVFVFVNPPNPRASDTVSIDVFVFKFGRLVDADELPRIRLVQYSEDKAVGDFVRVGLGHYRAHVDLWTLWPGYPGPSFTASGLFYVWGNVSGIPYGRQVPLWYYSPGLYFRTSTNVTHPRPGDAIALRVEVFHRSTLMDPYNLSAHLRLPTRPASVVELTLAREGRGVYVANFTLPEFAMDLGLAIAYRRPYVEVSADYLRVDFDSKANFQYARYQVWFHRTPLTANTSRGEFWVADDRGQPAAGVEVRLHEGGGQWLEVLTEPSGRVPVELVFEGEDLPLGGRVGEGTPGMNFFDPPIVRPGSGTVAPLDPVIMPDGGFRDLLQPNTTVTRRYQLANWTVTGPGELIANETVGYYVWTGHYLVEAGDVRTDDEGQVSLSFAVPQRNLYVGFTHGLDYAGERYEAFRGAASYTVASPAAGLHVSPLTLGGATVVRGNPAGELRDLIDQYRALYHHASVQVLTLPSGETWQQWDHAGDAMHTTEYGYEHAFYLPAFLPDDADYLVRTSLYTGSERLSQFVVLRPGEEADIPVGDLDPRVAPSDSEWDVDDSTDDGDPGVPPSDPGGDTDHPVDDGDPGVPPSDPPSDIPDLLTLGIGVAVAAAAAGAILTVVLRRRGRPPPPGSGS